MKNYAKWVSTAIVCFGFPSSAMAEFQLPNGCTAYLTVQSKACNVTHYYTCDSDPEGHQWRVDIDDRGPLFFSQIDRETRWITSVDLTSGVTDRLDEDGSNKHASFTELTRGNVNEFDFQTNADDGTTLRVKGFDRLTGKTVVIDDVPLLETESDVTATDGDGDLVWAAKGNELISLEHRVFYSGITEWRTDDGTVTIDSSPLEFINPGEPGFLAETPKYDCESTMSHLDMNGDDNDKI